MTPPKNATTGLTAGIHDITGDDYHADDLCDQPSLSASIARILVTASPAHARHAHPRLNPNYVREEEQKFDIGTAAHALLLEGREAVTIIEAPDWRTNEAKALRDEARADGKLPLLGKHWDDVRAMVDAAVRQLADHEARPPLFDAGKPEQTIVWEEDGVACRSRLDWLRDDLTAIDDYKTSSRSASPEQFSRTLFGMGYDVQAAFYVRGLRAVMGADPAFRFVVQETSPPYVLSVVELGPDVYALADAKVDYAISLWRRCLANDSWPGYTTRVATAELPPWEETRWLERSAA